MKFGLRTPSLKRRFAARTSWKRYVRNNLGLKAPRGFGFITNPKRAVYNRVYNRTSFSVDKLFKASKTSSSHAYVSSNKSSWSFLINVIIFIILLGFFFPLAIVFLVYKLYSSSKSKNKLPDSQDQIQSANESNVALAHGNNDLISQFHIPEPTRSLLWVTDDDISKIQNPMSVQITINISKRTVDEKDGHNFYGEPSLIWTRLPVEPNNGLETKAMYYPSYSGLDPQHRYQYLNWLRDVTQETNLSYVFLYYYGLERHLLVGNYELAVDEILRLIKYHDKGTFRYYAVSALISASGYRKKPDIVFKAPIVLEDFGNESLLLRRLARKPLTAKEIMNFSGTFGFSNKRYITKYPKSFEEELQKQLDSYDQEHGDILQSIDLASLPQIETNIMANLSLPDDIRARKLPQLLQSPRLKEIVKSLLVTVHQKIKNTSKENLH